MRLQGFAGQKPFPSSDIEDWLSIAGEHCTEDYRLRAASGAAGGCMLNGVG